MEYCPNVYFVLPNGQLYGEEVDDHELAGLCLSIEEAGGGMRLGNILSCETATYLFWWLLDERHAHGTDLVLPVDEVDALAIVSWPVGMETKIAVTDALVKVAVREGWRITKTDGRGPYRC